METPPNDPNYPQGYAPQPEEPDDEQLNTRGTSLGGGPGKVIVGGGLIIALVIYLIYSMFSDAPTPKGVNPLNQNQTGDAKAVAGGADIPSTPQNAPIPPAPRPMLPPPPSSPDLSPPGQLPTGSLTNTGDDIAVPPPLPGLDGNGIDAPPPAPPVPSIDGFGKTAETNEKKQARMRSNMLIVDGQEKAATDTSANPSDQSLNAADANRAFASNVLSATPAEKSVATRLSNLNLTIAQGKIVNAVLETAINTDLPGMLRAIVSRDTYAEAGRGILIPKGSRLLGTYNTGVVRGQKRVMIIWTRLIRPDGMDIQIGSPASDALGRAGVPGFVDNKYLEIFSAAMLTTTMSIGAAVAADKLTESDNSSTTTNTDGSTTTNATPGAIASAKAVNDLSAISRDVVDKIIDYRPTITIDQGTRINVFVNRDLIFPSAVADSEAFVQ